MKLEQICVSLELSKKLNEAGYPQESLFHWRKYSLADKPALYQIPEGTELGVLSGKLQFDYSAPTASELGEALPNFVYMGLSGGGRHGERVGYVVGESFHKRELWAIALAKGFERDCVPKEISSKNLADGMAKMWLYLKENGLL